MMKYVMFFCFLLILVACTPSAPSESDIQTAIAQTAEAAITPTPVPPPTSTPLPELGMERLNLAKYFKDTVTGDESLYYDVEFKRYLEPVIFMPADSNTYDFFVNSTYVGEDWLFVDSVIINADGEVYNLPLCSYDDDILDGGKISEFWAICFDTTDAEMLDQILASDSVVVRLDGDEGNYDREMYLPEKKALKYIYDIYLRLMDGSLEIKDGIETGAGTWWE